MDSMKNLKGFISNIGNEDVDFFSSKEHETILLGLELMIQNLSLKVSLDGLI